MAIKADLDKTYNRLYWDFIQDTLLDVGFPLTLINAIMECIVPVSMQIVWNRRLTDEFVPNRGIKQGCPLFPYIFVLCMERLDDLFLFVETNANQAYMIKDSLITFRVTSGHKVNDSKTTVFFSKILKVSSANAIYRALGFCQSDYLETYLGVTLFHKRVTKNTFNFIINKVKRKLDSWNASMLSMAGRVTLVQSILLSIPNYFKQTVKITHGTCADI
ncbi:hypothetical protein J1N35_034742 [Gossypium stocksii]|uniref:Reverse transcriptase domain-containing protein n=1 Tax=Gossypium stocksii TaxID=47602 RepID=A0A9D3ZQU1_9ROSI|nr:hypothetical protein J1N35_034742 [Gossypium stocksii]